MNTQANILTIALTLAFALALAACGDGPVTPDPEKSGAGLDMKIVRSSATTLPSGVDRVKLRAWNETKEEIVDVQIPAEGDTRQVEIPVPKGTYNVGLMTYNSSVGEAYGFADSTGIKVKPKLATNLSFTIGEVTSGPDYLLNTELQVKTTFPEHIDISTFWTAPPLHPNHPPATLLYDPMPFQTSADFSAPLTPELDAYYIAYLDEILTPAFTDSVHFRVKTPVRSEWDAAGQTGLAVYAPSVSEDEAAFGFALDGSIIVTFVERMKALGRFDK